MQCMKMRKNRLSGLFDISDQRQQRNETGTQWKAVNIERKKERDYEDE